MSAIVERWHRFGDQAWTRDGRLGLTLIVASALVTILIAFLGPSTVALNVGPAGTSLLPPWFIPVEWGKAIGLPLSEWVVVPVLWVGIIVGAFGLVIAHRAVVAGWRPRIRRPTLVARPSSTRNQPASTRTAPSDIVRRFCSKTSMPVQSFRKTSVTIFSFDSTTST